MKVTIGIPFYNAEKFIGLAIRSVLNQSFKDFELILSDDGSSDNSFKIASSFSDPRITLIKDNQNKGLSFRLNEQLKIAKGIYFARMDADDLMFPQRIEKQLKEIEKSGADIVGSQAVVIDNDNKILGLRKTTTPKNLSNIFRATPFIHPTVMGRTEWFRKYYYSENLCGYEDIDLWLRSFRESLFAILDEPLMFYRDPLDMRLRTYLFRLNQARKAYRLYDQTLLPVIFKNRLIILSCLKAFTYSAASVTGFKKYIVSRRNDFLKKEEKEFFQVILNNQL